MGMSEVSDGRITLREIRAAASRLEGTANRTPVLTSRTLDEMTGAKIFIKAESFQRTGTFKFRGAFNKIDTLTPDELQRGIAAFSSGNHAQAVALAARIKGVHAVILMPEDTPAVKMAATKGYGAEVVTYDRYTEDREVLGAELAIERGLTLVPPYEDPAIIAGQGTVALELLDEVGPLDVLFVPVGGGGLIAGCATVAKELYPQIRVLGVEPEAGNDTKLSLEAGQRISIPVPRTIADGLQASIPGALTFEVNRRLLDDILLVSDAEIVDAMTWLFDRMKVVTEPSGASAVSAVLARKSDVSGCRVGIVISGGNVGLERFLQIIGDRI